MARCRRRSSAADRVPLKGTLSGFASFRSMSEQPRLILLVEDEPLVRWIALDALEAGGYEVIEAVDAEQALAALRAREGISLLFTDVNMPGPMDGLALAEFVHARWPAVRLVVTSGRGLDRPVPDDGAFLRKPYSVAELQNAIRDAGGPPPVEAPGS
jgi:two-component system, response regulator PdtaR